MLQLVPMVRHGLPESSNDFTRSEVVGGSQGQRTRKSRLHRLRKPQEYRHRRQVHRKNFFFLFLSVPQRALLRQSEFHRAASERKVIEPVGKLDTEERVQDMAAMSGLHEECGMVAERVSWRIDVSAIPASGQRPFPGGRGINSSMHREAANTLSAQFKGSPAQGVVV